MADPEKTIRDGHVCLCDDGLWRPCPASLCEGLALMALLAEKDAKIERLSVMDAALRFYTAEAETPPTRLDRRTRETLEAAGRALSDTEMWMRSYELSARNNAPRLVWDAQCTTLREAHSQIVHLLAEEEGEPPVVLPIREEPRCTGHCIFGGDILIIEDLSCPIHGHEAQEKAKAAGMDRVEWTRACRAWWPFAPAVVPKGQPTGKGYTAEEAETAAANNVSINELRAHRKRHAPAADPAEQPHA